jgi:hypothetical protein
MKNLLLYLGFGLGVFAIYNHVKKQNYPNIYYVGKLPNNFNAQTIAPFGIWIKESEKDNQNLLLHELVHWKQYQDKGLLQFYYDYFTQIAKYGYDNAPMEIEARANEVPFCQTNYTECVQNGTAKTVFNPNFRN